MVLPFDLLGSSSGLVTSPMALPFFQRLTLWLAGTGGLGAAVNTEVGSRAQVVPLLPETGDILERTEELLVLDDRGQGGRSASLVWQGGMPRLVGDVIDRAGFTTFLAAGDTVGLVAAAIPAAESNGVLLGSDQWQSLMQGWGLTLTADLTAGRPTILGGILAGRDLAPWFFLLALLFAAAGALRGTGTGSETPLSG